MAISVYQRAFPKLRREDRPTRNAASAGQPAARQAHADDGDFLPAHGGSFGVQVAGFKRQVGKLAFSDASDWAAPGTHLKERKPKSKPPASPAWLPVAIGP
jgi:hypothetical protein